MNDFVPHGKIVHVESCVRAEKERVMPPIVGILIVFILLFLILGIVISCVKIVPQSNCYVVERLGVYHATWETGRILSCRFLTGLRKRFL